MRVDLNECRTSRLPDDGDQNFGWTIKRTGIDGPSKLLCLSSDIFGIRVHFYRGRTGPCTTRDCEACKAQHLSRWKGYLLAIETATRQQVIFEFTPPGATILDAARKEYGTLRGLQIIASRVSSKPNAKVMISVKGITVLPPHACPDYAVWPILAHIWGVASDNCKDFVKGHLDDLSGFERAA